MSKRWLVSIVANVMLLGSTDAAPVQGGMLNVPVINTGFTENYNPFINQDVLVGTMFEPLLVFNTLTNRTQYRLIESAQYANDLKSLTLRLRNNLRWSDGRLLTAEDIVFSYQFIKAFPEFDTNFIWSSGKLVDIKAIDRQTVVFTLSEPDSTFLWIIADYHIVPKHVWQNVKDVVNFTNSNPVGSGPMTTVELVENTQLRLCRNPFYYLLGRPFIDCVNFKSYPDEIQATAALLAGEIDWSAHYVSDVEYRFSSRADTNHFWYPANQAVNLYLNSSKAPLRDLAVRQALSMALNREEMVNIVLSGHALVNPNLGGLAQFYQHFVDETVHKQYGGIAKYNRRQAKKLLDQAGVYDRDGDGYRENKDGSALQLEIEVVNFWTDWIRIAQVMVQYFADIGINTKLKQLDWGEYTQNLATGSYSMAISWSKAAYNPIFTFQDFYPNSLAGIGYHTSYGIDIHQPNAHIAAFENTNDPEQQQEIIDKLQHFTAQHLPFIPLFSNPTWFQYSSKTLAGWPSKDNPYIQPVWQHGGSRVIILNNLYLK